jgi:hypothetical protein
MTLDEKKEIAKQELKKVFFLASNGVDVKMFSKFIDSIWHELLKDKKQYEDFCIEACGNVIFHSESSGEGVIDFIEIYEEKYGKMPDVWFMDKNGDLDRKQYESYHGDNKFITGWDCTPTHNCL